MRLAILSPVYEGYRWLAPFMSELLDRFWPGHPPLFFCGLSPGEAVGLPLAAGRPPGKPAWADFVLPGATWLRQQGFESCYLLLEEHLPLGPCNAAYLNRELPQLMEELGGVYASLMGWDNRRYLIRGTFVSGKASGLLRLDKPEAPRFHLHPAWWRLDALEACLRNAISGGGGTAWAFEKINDRWSAPLPEEWKRGCFQIEGWPAAVLRGGRFAAAAHKLSCAFYRLLMRLYPLFARAGIGAWYWAALGFDNFFYRGPYPMFYSGVMTKGGLNRHWLRWISSRPELRPAASEIIRKADEFAGLRGLRSHLENPDQK